MAKAGPFARSPTFRGPGMASRSLVPARQGDSQRPAHWRPPAVTPAPEAPKPAVPEPMHRLAPAPGSRGVSVRSLPQPSFQHVRARGRRVAWPASRRRGGWDGGPAIQPVPNGRWSASPPPLATCSCAAPASTTTARIRVFTPARRWRRGAGRACTALPRWPARLMPAPLPLRVTATCRCS